MPDFPQIRGLTETQQDTESPMLRLQQDLVKRRNGSADDISEAIDSLQRASRFEANPELRSRIGAAITMLKRGPRRQ